MEAGEQKNRKAFDKCQTKIVKSNCFGEIRIFTNILLDEACPCISVVLKYRTEMEGTALCSMPFCRAMENNFSKNE